MTSEKTLHELRINGAVVETSENAADLYWKARRAACGTTNFAEVETVSGPAYASAFFTDAILAPWERVAKPEA